MPAVADIQNTIVKEFEGDPRVVTAVISQDEPKATLETFWRNLYLRGTMIYDALGEFSRDAYGQPDVGLPASRWFVIGPDQTIVLPQYGYDPDLAIETIYAQLEAMEGSGDFDGDTDVDAGDFQEFDSCFDVTGRIPPGCEEGDLDGDGDIDCEDWYSFILAWTAPGQLPTFPRCPAALTTTMDSADLSWTPVSGAMSYDVMQGDLHALRTTSGDFRSSASGCVQDGLAGTSVSHGAAPPTGEVSWFLVRVETVSGAATYDSLAPSQIERRDPGIGASNADCP